MTRWFADDDFVRHLGDLRTRDDAVAMVERAHAHWDEHAFGPLAVEDKETGRLIGRTGPAYHAVWPDDPEVGWWIAPELHGRGLATEAGAASRDWTLNELGFARVVSIALEANVASRRVMEKLGFRLHAKVPSQWGELWVHALDR